MLTMGVGAYGMLSQSGRASGVVGAWTGLVVTFEVKGCSRVRWLAWMLCVGVSESVPKFDVSGDLYFGNQPRVDTQHKQAS